MNKTDEKRQIIIEMAADHLLERGMQEATLRKLAKSVGVSDRMLMHYFSNKEELLQAILTVITARLVHLLESAKTEQMPFEIFPPTFLVIIINAIVFVLVCAVAAPSTLNAIKPDSC